MLGETIAILRKVEGKPDEFGEPTLLWKADEGENCLVRPLMREEAKEANRPDSIRVEFSIALPKSYTQGLVYGDLHGARIVLTDRGMNSAKPEDALRVTGTPEPTRPCPTEWDTLIECGRVYG